MIITQFGKPVGEPVITPGLKVKMPFIQKANYFDKRFLEWDGDPNQVPTKDKRFIYVDTYARWRITDPLLFFQRLRDERGAQSRLDDILDGETRNTIAKHDLIEVVRSDQPRVRRSSSGRSRRKRRSSRSPSAGGDLEQEVLANASARTADLGIEILDFRFKRINYVEEVAPQGLRADDLRAPADRRGVPLRGRRRGGPHQRRARSASSSEITSEAYRQAQEIRGEADAEAADIYAEAYNRDPDFYRFLKTMEVYTTTMDKRHDPDALHRRRISQVSREG